jgi:hypothetical protein
MRDFLVPEPAFEDVERVAMFGSTTWMKTLALRELRLDFEDQNTRFMTLNGMEQGSAHQLLDVETIIAAFEQC